MSEAAFHYLHTIEQSATMQIFVLLACHYSLITKASSFVMYNPQEVPEKSKHIKNAACLNTYCYFDRNVALINNFLMHLV